jgi:Peptidase family M23
MTRHRTTARGASLLLLTALLAAAIVGSPGAAPKPGLVDGKPIVFPLIGDYPYSMNYGDARANGRHAGIDIENTPWRAPVVAAEAGKVRWHTTSSRAGCMLYLYGKSGTTYLYIHLNNDLTERSEDRGGCKLGTTYAVEDGAAVTAGEQIAFNGDSGDAEGNYHLHFEVHPNDGPDVNPYPYLNAAERLLFPGRIGAIFSIGVRGVPIAAGAGSLTLRASAVRWWPGGQWTSLVRDRNVELAVGPGALVDSTLAAALAGPEHRALQSRSTPTFTAFTAKGKVTAATLRGAAGTLVATRVTRPGGTSVSTEPAQPAQRGPATEDATWLDPGGKGDERACVYRDPGCSGS